jgi:pimeloyl-ACP methyl ester carboxylesterase
VSAQPFDWGSDRVHVEDDGSGEAVVLVHSSGFSGRQWRRLAELLVRKELRVIVPDLLGSGQSSEWPDRQPFTFHDDIDLLDALLERIGAPVHLVGHSYGGLIALQAAARQPARVRSLALYDPVVYGALDAQRDADALGDLSRLTFAASASASDLETWLEGFVNYWNGPDAWAQLSAPTRADLNRVGWVVHEGARTLIADRTPASAYAELRAPTLLLGGAVSPLAAQRVVARLAEALPNARTETVANAGHMGPLTHGNLVNEMIAAHVVAARAREGE